MNSKGYIYAILAAMSWGLIYNLDQKVLKTVSPLILIFSQSILFTVISLIAITIKPDLKNSVLQLSSAQISLILLTCIISLIANFFILSSISMLDASTSAIIEITYPIFIIIFAFFIFKTIPNIYFIIGSALVLSGLVIIIKNS